MLSVFWSSSRYWQLCTILVYGVADESTSSSQDVESAAWSQDVQHHWPNCTNSEELASGREEIGVTIDPLLPLTKKLVEIEEKLYEKCDTVAADGTDGEILPNGYHLDYGKWKTLNRIRTWRSPMQVQPLWMVDGECREVRSDKHSLECAFPGGCDKSKLTGKIEASLEDFLKYWRDKGI